jgi:LacI family transcriptional regulator
MPTIREVAEKAGVSYTTVSHVINNTRYVSENVRERVLAAMKDLGYRPNALARSLRRGETKTIGLILPDSANPFFAEVGRVIENAAFRSGYNVILCNTEGDINKERVYTEVLQNKQVDGIVFVAAGDQPDALQEIAEGNLPVVVIDRDSGQLELDTVITDNLTGGAQAAHCLSRLIDPQVACITGPSNLTPSAQRVIGFQQALSDLNINIREDWIVRGDFHPDSGYKAAYQLLQLTHRPNAIFSCNDMMAIGVLRAAAELGLCIPDDLQVVGFDDIELASYTHPPLSTVAQPKKEIGETSVRLLLERINNNNLPARREILPTKLILRKTTR